MQIQVISQKGNPLQGVLPVINSKKIVYGLLTILFIFGCTISLFYGRIGYCPIDQSIVFDGGWRIYSGQLPYRDFTTPNGITSIFIQALFFRVFGVNWFAYCLHAAVFNGLFCIIVFMLLRFLNGSKLISFLYAALSGVVFYPAFGVPFIEQHSFFFILLALLMILAARRMARNYQIIVWLIIPGILALAFFSKQIPGIFGIGLVAIVYILELNIERILCFLSGTFFVLTLLRLISVSQSIDLERFYYYFLTLPSQIGQDRVSSLHNPLSLLFKIVEVTYGWKLISIFCIHIIAFYMLILIGFSRSHILASKFSPKLEHFSQFLKEVVDPRHIFLVLILSEGLILTCTFFCVLTNQETVNGIPYVFVAIGILHITSSRIIQNIKHYKRRITILATLNFILLGIAFYDAYYFNLTTNSTRAVQSFDYKFAQSQTFQGSLPTGMRFMQWIYPSYLLPYTPEEFTSVFDFLNTTQRNFYLHGDSSILYGLTGRPSISPTLWFHPGLTAPYPETPQYNEYQNRFRQNMKTYNPSYLVLENAYHGNGTLQGDRPGSSSLLSQLLQDSTTKEVFKAGVFTIFEIDSTFIYD